MSLLISTESDGSRWVSLDDLREKGIDQAALEAWVSSPRLIRNPRDSGICNSTVTALAICNALGLDGTSTSITIHMPAKGAPKITVEKHLTVDRGDAIAKVFQTYVPVGYTE